MEHIRNKQLSRATSSADPEGGQGAGPPPPPGKSQVIWVSIWNKQLDPPPPGKSWTPPPGKNDRFLYQLTSVK